MKVAFVALFLSLFVLSAASAQNWQTVYQTQFSSDPAWTTNSATYYHWDETTGTYYADQFHVNYGGYYTYHDAGYDGGSLVLEWDVKILECHWAHTTSFGLRKHLDIDLPDYARLLIEGCNRTTLAWETVGNWGNAVDMSTQWEIDTWYHIAMEYNKNTNTLTADVSLRETGESFISLSCTVVGAFDDNMKLIGASDFRPNGTFASTCCHAVSVLDNVTYALDLEIMPVNLDIKPGSCPNPLNVKAPKHERGNDLDGLGVAAKDNNQQARMPKPVLPAVIHGTADFDATDIDPTTVMLEGVPVLRWNIEDVSTPVGEDAAECECTNAGPDGYPDLTFKFDRGLVVDALGEVYDGDLIPLTITGELFDGTPIEGTDCVIILNGDDPPDEFAFSDKEPQEPALIGNYPNPFNPTTQISFSLPEAADVRLEIYNITGQKVATLTAGRLEAGHHSIEWDGSDVASGVYLYRLEAGDFVDTKKMVLLK